MTQLCPYQQLYREPFALSSPAFAISTSAPASAVTAPTIPASTIPVCCHQQPSSLLRWCQQQPSSPIWHQHQPSSTPAFK